MPTTGRGAPSRRRLTAMIGAAAVGLMLVLSAGCSGKTTVKADGAAQSVVDVLSQQTGFHPTDVHCPSGVEAKAGGQFDCHFTGPEGGNTPRTCGSQRLTASASNSP